MNDQSSLRQFRVGKCRATGACISFQALVLTLPLFSICSLLFMNYRDDVYFQKTMRIAPFTVVLYDAPETTNVKSAVSHRFIPHYKNMSKA
jgi:hypothetical protein